MKNSTIDMVAIEPKKANAQNLTCFIACIAIAVLAIMAMATACILPKLMNVTEATCWICMALEAASAGLGFVAFWIKQNTLS